MQHLRSYSEAWPGRERLCAFTSIDIPDHVPMLLAVDKAKLIEIAEAPIQVYVLVRIEIQHQSHLRKR